MKKSIVIVMSSMVVLLVVATILVWLVKPYYPYLGKDFVIPSATRTPTVPVEISYEDKVQILSEVIKQFPDMEPKSKRKTPPRSEFNIVKETIPLPSFAAHLQDVPGITVNLITDLEIDAQKQVREIEYYEFRDFRLVDGNIVVAVIWNKRDKDSSHTTGFDFTATRSADKWVVDRKVTGVTVGEHP